jgi:hypothetical protein
MRLDAEEVQAIKTAARDLFGPAAVVRLYGSRVDDAKRGGDIDLHLEVPAGTATPAMMNELSWALAHAIGEQKIDIRLQPIGAVDEVFDRVAKTQGIVL